MLISLDVGFAKTGWTVFDKGEPIEAGVILTPKSAKKGIRTADDSVTRASLLVTSLKAIIEKYGCQAVIGELPSGGAQSAIAMRDMAGATCAVAGLVACMGLPCEWCTPTEVKLAATGLKSGTKEEIMQAVAKRYGWRVDLKIGINQKGGEIRRYTFHVLGKKLPGGVFEDLADSIAAYWALRSSNMVKMFG